MIYKSTFVLFVLVAALIIFRIVNGQAKPRVDREQETQHEYSPAQRQAMAEAAQKMAALAPRHATVTQRGITLHHWENGLGVVPGFSSPQWVELPPFANVITPDGNKAFTAVGGAWVKQGWDDNGVMYSEGVDQPPPEFPINIYTKIQPPGYVIEYQDQILAEWRIDH